MNPPSALHSAMSKERKPFTYTPGGLNLSEIKSERMAQRLMRNAMNQGVPEKPVQTIQSPPVLASNAMPNFNCLPVQVFPTFSLPANPKSLLRTRSNPDAPKPAPTNVVPKFCTDSTPNVYSYKNVNKPSILPPNNNIDNNKQSTFNDYNTETNDYSLWQPTNYESDTSKFLTSQSKMNSDLQSKPSEIITNITKNKINEDVNTASNDEDSQIIKKSSILLENSESNDFNSIGSCFPHLQEKKDDDYEKKEVKIAKKQTKSNNEVDRNGDTEAEIIVKLPSKKSAAKTETTVDVLKKTLPDGTVQEVKTTTTKCTIDGKTEITTKTETRTFPKEVDDTEEIEEQEEEFEEAVEKNGQDEENEGDEDEVKKQTDISDDVQEEENNKVIKEPLEQSNKQNGHIIIEEEKTEKNTTQKVVISQSAEQESEEEIEEVEEEDDGETEDVSVEQVIILKKSANSPSQGELNKEEVKDPEVEDDEEIIEDEEVEEEEEEYENEKEKDSNIEKNDKAVKEQIEDEDKLLAPEGDSESIVENELSQNDESKPIQDSGNEDESVGEGEVEGQNEGELQSEGEDEDKGEEEIVANKEIQEEIRTVPAENEIVDVDIKVTKKETISPDVQDDNDIPVSSHKSQKDLEKLSLNDLSSEPIKDNEKHERKEETIIKTTLQYEPSIPLEKVEDVEIKPIGPAQEIFKKSHTEIITTKTDKPIGALSTQTEFNRVENIITVNRTSKTLDHAYDQIAPSSIPTLNTYFTQNNNRILSSPHPVLKPHQPIYPPEPQTERRHSLLLERLSVERQIPTSDIYQNNYYPTQNQEQPQWLQEPQSEVLTVSNVKPSEITKNQQWYQQTRKEESTYNTVSQTPNSPTPQWNKPATLTQVQQHYQPQPQVQAQPQLQLQYQSFAQPQYAPKPEFAPSYTENKTHSKFNNYQQNTYPSYVPKPTWVSSTFDPKPTVQPEQFSSLKKESTESYQTSTQQLSSSYVPPPWEQDSSYVSNTTNYYQPPPPTTSLTPSTNLAWKPQPSSKFSKPAPTSYVPPAPNQSFVKPVTADDPRLPGRKTYYSEYERRYISVPEATYVPGETKLQAQLDPSPQYYCDINEPTEPVEPQWRRELREFTEKTQTTQTETTSVRPPWEEDSKYTASTDFTTPAPTGWTQTQTLRPRSLRERSYEPEYANSKEWPRTNTLGRGRPQSSYVKSNVETLPQRPRGVSVDRYNPNSYLAPTSEHPPVQSQTMNPNIHPKSYHNPTIPAYHARVSAEPREQPAYIQPRSYIDSRAPPVQSRSFKYLQWITGTED